MTWLDDTLDDLGSQPAWGYQRARRASTEPTALAAMALASHGRFDAAAPLLATLLAQQQADGSLGVGPGEPFPRWPTSQAIVAWTTATAEPQRYADAVGKALDCMQAIRGLALEQTEEMGHNMSLVGWPWVEGTHSWSEPTAWQVLALEANGRADDQRAREGVRLLIDRLLPGGGSNYGNTVVLGQALRPHLHPTGCVLMALAGKSDSAGKVRRSGEYLLEHLGPTTPSASLSYSILGLAAQGVFPPDAAVWLEAAHARTVARGAAPLQLALLALAAAGPQAATLAWRTRPGVQP